MPETNQTSLGIDGLRGDIAAQREYMRGRNVTYERVLGVIDDLLDGDLGARLESCWNTRVFGAFYERPLLLMASVRFDALREGANHPLWAALGNDGSSPGAATPDAVSQAFATGRPVWESIERRYVQTNETSRAVVWLWPAQLLGVRDVALVDIGASAGLNLVGDALPRLWTQPSGEPLATAGDLDVRCRLGYDARPIDAMEPEQADWLRACIWAGEDERLSRLELALEARRAIADVRLEVSSARDVPERLRAESFGGASLVLAYQSSMRGYLDADEWRDYESGMLDWLGARPTGSAVWLQLETGIDDAHAELPADITANVAGPNASHTLRLARCEYHPRHVEPLADGVRQLRASAQRQ